VPTWRGRIAFTQTERLHDVLAAGSFDDRRIKTMNVVCRLTNCISSVALHMTKNKTGCENPLP
jgi:L-rhamnose isomerase